MLSKVALAEYRRDGFLFPLRVFSIDDAVSCKARLDDYAGRFGDDARGRGMMTKRFVSWHQDANYWG
jgi:hypothetical protein